MAGLPQMPSHQNRCNAQELENRMRGVLARETDPGKTSVEYPIHTAPLQQPVCQLVNHRFVGSLIQSTLTFFLCYKYTQLTHIFTGYQDITPPIPSEKVSQN